MPNDHIGPDAKREDELPPESIEYLHREIGVGMEQSQRGQSTPLDMAAIKQKVRERTNTMRRGS